MAKSKKPRKAYRPGARASSRILPREAKAFQTEIRRLLGDCLRDDVYSVKGEAYFLLNNGQLCLMHIYLVSYAKMWIRVMKGENILLDFMPLLRLSKKLAAGTPVTEEEVRSCVDTVDRVEQTSLNIDFNRLKQYVRTEEIAVEMELLKLAA